MKHLAGYSTSAGCRTWSAGSLAGWEPGRLEGWPAASWPAGHLPARSPARRSQPPRPIGHTLTRQPDTMLNSVLCPPNSVIRPNSALCPPNSVIRPNSALCPPNSVS